MASALRWVGGWVEERGVNGWEMEEWVGGRREGGCKEGGWVERGRVGG